MQLLEISSLLHIFMIIWLFYIFLHIHKLAILLICIEHCLSGVILHNIFMYMVQNNVILRNGKVFFFK